MTSVTSFTKILPKPRNQYLSFELFEERNYKHDDEDLSNYKSDYPRLIGLAVDYLSRYVLSDSAIWAFEVPLKGANLVDEYLNANYLLREVWDMTDQGIANAIKLCGYDSVIRAGKDAYKDVNLIKPSQEDIKYVRVMVDRTVAFLNEIDAIEFGTSFNPRETKTKVSDDIDFLTSNGILDIKVLQKEPTNLDILQLLTYYVLLLNGN